MYDTRILAEKIAKKMNFPVAEMYNLSYREFDDMIEVIGLVADPNCDVYEYDQLKLEIPKCWVTLGVVPASKEVEKAWLE
jgi:hypothetical protein